VYHTVADIPTTSLDQCYQLSQDIKDIKTHDFVKILIP